MRIAAIGALALAWLPNAGAAAQEGAKTFGNPWMAKLTEVEPPPPVSWWPPAPGWYVLAGVLALALLWLLGRGVRRWRANAYRREGARLVRATTALAPAAALDAIAAVLKRVAMTTFGRDGVAPLSGADWVAFLDRTGRTTEFSEGPGAWPAALRYAAREGPIPPERLHAVRRTGVRWIHRHRVLEEVRR